MYLVDRKQTPRGVAETGLPFDGYKGGNEASSYTDNNITGVTRISQHTSSCLDYGDEESLFFLCWARELLLLLSNPFGPYRREGRVVRSCPLSLCVGSNSCNDRQGCGWLYIGTRGGTCTRMLWCTCVVSSCTSAGLFNHTHMILTLFL